MRDAGAARSAAMLRAAMGAEVSRALANPHVLEITVNPDGCMWLDPAIQGRVDTGVCLTTSVVGQIDRLVASQAGQAPGADHPIVSAELPATDERFEGVHAAGSPWSLLLNPSTDRPGHRPRCLRRDQCLDPCPGGPAAATHPDPPEHRGGGRCLLGQDDARQHSPAQDARPGPPRRAAVILSEHKLYAARSASIYRRGDSMKLNFSWVPGQMATEDLLRDCACLYSKHYGFWSQSSSTLAGKRVRLSSTRLRNWLNDKDSKIALAYDDAELVGYAIAIQTKEPRYGFISWVIQFVVHEDYRRRNVGKTLLFSIWGFTDHFAWGLLTASPYAVRALEKATRRRCDPARIKKNCRKLYSVGRVHVPYVTEETNIEISSGSTGRSRIRTGFCLDHSDLNKTLAQVTTEEKPWRLGPIEEGWEWFAFTFADQEQLRLTSEELNSMLEASDQITVQAYSRMLLNSEHHWAQHACKESCEIVEYCQIKPGQSVLDFGCGIGRHAIRLAKLGARVTGVDYVETFVEKAKSHVPQQLVHEPCFILADCRDVKLEQRFDAVLCLYDVIGTYADTEENTKILTNIAHHLKPKGWALLSVMNLALTRMRAKHCFSIEREPNKLLKLRPSRTMESTGDIFDPDFYLLDKDTSVVYRKEQFTEGKELPTELLVRDRRFSKKEIKEMCNKAGLEVVWTKFVRAGRWQEPLAERDPQAKEILLLCRRCP